jgi:uncharacterized protein (TIGR02687 family)
MEINRIKDKLEELFETHRVVFWNDSEGECEADLQACVPEGVSVLRPDIMGQLKTKVTIEIERPTDQFLVYAPVPEPDAKDDWLMDIRLYGRQFYADTASMIVDDLGLQHHHMREHIQQRKKFFASKQRVAALKAILLPQDMEKDIDRKMFAVLVKAENDRFSDIVQGLFCDYIFDEGLDYCPEAFKSIQKMDLEESFWALAREVFGYQQETPSLRHFLTCLLVSDLYTTLGAALSNNVRQFVLPGGFIRDAAVCMSEWRDSVRMASAYDHLSKMVAEALGIANYMIDVPVESLKDAVTFFDIERVCAGRIKQYMLEHEDTLDAGYVGSFCRARQNMHWSNKRLGGDLIPRDAFWSVYEALIAAAEFIDLKKEYPEGFRFEDAKGYFEAYKTDLFQFDRLYRLFNEHASFADSKGWGLLKELRERIEDMYQHWFLDELALVWESKADLKSWKTEGVHNQYDFYGSFPEKKIGDKNATVYVIISDALRYEVGNEIAEALNGRYRFKATCEAMLSCVPSYTSIGMAALLPHKQIEISDKGDILVDGKGCASLNQRNDVLSSYKGMAIKAEEFRNLSRDAARELMRDKKIVYVYHNTIDAIGDDAKTEDKTFAAVRTAVAEVCDMTAFAVNNLSAKYVFVTADHGFVYTNRRPDATDRNKVSDSGIDLMKMNKRYAINKDIPMMANVTQGKLSVTSGVSPEKDIAFVIPKGMNLFYFTGGARFFHGGMSLQEVVVPVITVEQVRGKEKEKTREKTVGLQVLGQDHRITTGRHRFEILQTEAVSERVKAVTYKIGIYAENEPVSDLQTMTFDSVSQEMADRKKEITLTLKNMVFSNTEKYRLVFRNANTDIDEQSIPVRIDRAFTSDF